MAAQELQSAVGSLIAGVGLTAALVLGAVWTAMAVVDGNVGATAVRFVAAIGAGLFYLMLLRAARSAPR